MVLTTLISQNVSYRLDNMVICPLFKPANIYKSAIIFRYLAFNQLIRQIGYGGYV